jgi:hypothetical protein
LGWTNQWADHLGEQVYMKVFHLFQTFLPKGAVGLNLHRVTSLHKLFNQRSQPFLGKGLTASNDHMPYLMLGDLVQNLFHLKACTTFREGEG